MGSISISLNLSSFIFIYLRQELKNIWVRMSWKINLSLFSTRSVYSNSREYIFLPDCWSVTTPIESSSTGACTGNPPVFTEATGQIILPRVAGTDRYAPYMQCQWTLTAPTEKRIVIEFNKFDVEAEADCSYDWVLIQEDGHEDRKYCGLERGGFKPVNPSKTNVVTIRCSCLLHKY